jgi:hypothetical protein
MVEKGLKVLWLETNICRGYSASPFIISWLPEPRISRARNLRDRTPCIPLRSHLLISLRLDAKASREIVSNSAHLEGVMFIS